VVIRTDQCDESELLAAEGRLQAQGYSLADVRAEKELRPMQYLKRRHGDSVTTFTDRYVWTLIWRSA
jgi:hypothetical protein